MNKKDCGLYIVLRYTSVILRYVFEREIGGSSSPVTDACILTGMKEVVLCDVWYSCRRAQLCNTAPTWTGQHNSGLNPTKNHENY